MSIRRIPKGFVKKLEEIGISPSIAKLATHLYSIGIDPPRLGHVLADLLSVPANPSDVGEFPDDYDETERRIAEMMTENTGMHVLDSGMLYGYHWIENRRRNLKKEPPILVTVFDSDDYTFTVSTFHFLRTFLELNDRARLLQFLFEIYSGLPENRYKSWLRIMEGFGRLLGEHGFEYLGVENTYNIEDSLLSQIIQYALMYEREWDEYYILLQIHGGCDIRGGYTKPQFFKVYYIGDEPYWYDAMCFVGLECPKCGPLYYTSDGYWRSWKDGDPANLYDVYGDPEKDAIYHSACGSEIMALPHFTILEYVGGEL